MLRTFGNYKHQSPKSIGILFNCF